MLELLTVQNLVELEGKINKDLPNYIPKLKEALQDEKFKYWFENKFCKWTQPVHILDLRDLVESLNIWMKENDKT
ncbi:hypothetical protein vBAbaPP1_175 [Acinetobacter phage vB_AbaM_P1]|nr:hypothetical protein vBAbaPP1_175 [Acinetobacter phage vB_AbaM_P1]WAX22657.1 plate protein [Acinetobacter phage vB_AbaP_HB01]